MLRSARAGTVARLLHVGGEPVVVRASQPAADRVVLDATGASGLEEAIERMRFALAVDDDLSGFYAAFRGDPLVGPAVRARPWHRPRRRPWAWEALAWAVTEQLIESSRAAAIQRRIVHRWGPGVAPDASGDDLRSPGATSRRRERNRALERDRAGVLRDVPAAATVAGRAPAELAALDLAPSRALALIRCAREVAAGRVDPGSPEGDRRLLRIPEIGPWTVQCLGLHGRGDPDSLPAGDLAYVKLVGRLSGLGRRATVPEIEEFFAPYAPYRGLAASFVLAHRHRQLAAGPPLRAAA